jgi:hypothetical protein
MPTALRRVPTSFDVLVSVKPPILISPPLIGSRPLRVLMKVLLPEPDGPADHHDLATGDARRAVFQNLKVTVALCDVADLDHHRAPQESLPWNPFTACDAAKHSAK